MGEVTCRKDFNVRANSIGILNFVVTALVDKPVIPVGLNESELSLFASKAQM